MCFFFVERCICLIFFFPISKTIVVSNAVWWVSKGSAAVNDLQLEPDDLTEFPFGFTSFIQPDVVFMLAYREPQWNHNFQLLLQKYENPIQNPITICYYFNN